MTPAHSPRPRPAPTRPIRGSRRIPGPYSGDQARNSAESAAPAVTAPPGDALPAGFVVELARGVRVLDAGRALLGSSQGRLLRLAATAASLLRERRIEVANATSAAFAAKLLDLGMADPVLDALPEATADAATLTVVVPFRDRPGRLARVVRSIPRGIRVIVVDDVSPRPDVARTVAEELGAEFVALPENLGPAGARNAGLALVTTPFVAFADSDVALRPGALDALLRHFADPRLALVAPRILGMAVPRGRWTTADGRPAGHGDTWVTRAIREYEQVRSSLDLGPRGGAVRPGSPIGWVPSACVVARTAALGGGFEAGMRVGEDVDLVWRLLEAGWRVRYEPAAEAEHSHRTAFLPWLRRKFDYGTSATPLDARHPGSVAPAILAPWTVAFLALVLVQRPWSWLAAGGLTAWAADDLARKRLQGLDHPHVVGARLAGRGATAALQQGGGLLLRHWWPLALVGGLLSRRVRRAVAAAAVADAAVDWLRRRPELDPVRYGVLRRLDDLAYGAGVWWSAIRGRSLGALSPRIVRAPRAAAAPDAPDGAARR